MAQKKGKGTEKSKKGRKQLGIRLIRIFGILSTFLVLLVLLLNFWIVSTTRESIFYEVADVPSRRVALLLGTSKQTTHGNTNIYFKERIEAAVKLYQLGIIQHIIVSGDNRTVYYNEPRDMLQALQAHGVPQAAITLDYAGFRTLDSVVRSKEVFGQDELLIITQDFHCYRALFIARFYEIDAIAFSADNKDELPLELAIREMLARANTVLDLYVFDTDPYFGG